MTGAARSRPPTRSSPARSRGSVTSSAALSLKSTGDVSELAERGLAELELKQYLIVEYDLSGLLEAVALVEGDRAAFALTGARAQHLDSGSAAQVLDDQVEGRGAEAAAASRNDSATVLTNRSWLGDARRASTA